MAPLSALFVILLVVHIGWIHCAMQKVLFPANVVQSQGARCLDGTPSGYYFEAATATANASNWVIFLEGGGACYTYSTCKERTLGTLGSSKIWPNSYVDPKNLLSTDPAVNPGFATWNHVWIPYCGGDCHTGQRTTVDPNWASFYFSGFLTVQAVWNQLKANHSFGSAKLVLLSGESAGGIGAFTHADGLAAFLPSAKVKASPQGGWFYPNVTYYSDWKQGKFVAVPDPSIGVLWDGYLNPDCVKDHNSDPIACNTQDVNYPYIKTPLYVVENKFDSNQIFTQLGCPQNATDTNDYISYFGNLMQDSINQVVNSPKKDGLFLMSCLEHTSNTYVSSPTTVQKTLQNPSLNDWFFEKNTVPHVLVDDCKGNLPCNPTCV